MLKKVQQSNWESELSLRKSIYLDATRFCKSGKMLFIYLFNLFFDTTRREYVVGSFKVSTPLVFLLTNLSSTKHNTNNTQRRNCWLISKWKLEPASNNKNNCIKILFVNKSHHFCYNLVTCRIMWSVIGYSCCAMYDFSSLLRPH